VLSADRNELITRTNAGTPGGELMRRYWQPVALSDELRADAPLPLKIMGEDLVLFRDGKGKPGLLGRRCPHRAVDLSYARVEEAGLRCIYHGWLISAEGQCLDRPTDPIESNPKASFRHTAYPCFEAGGLVFAYLGSGDAPRIPAMPFFAAPPDHVWVTRGLIECNYLQWNEGNIDPQHLSFLHRFLESDRALQPGYNDLLIRQTLPNMDLEETEFGFRLFTWRQASAGMKHVRVTNFIMPNLSTFDGNPLINPRKGIATDNLGYQFHWHVPIDDESHWKYFIFYRYDGPVDVGYLEQFFWDTRDDSPSSRTARNRYGQDREEMKHTTFAGLGPNFAAHDKCAVEAQGKIMDRSSEHLGATDRPVVVMRKQLLRGIEDVQAGRDPLLVERDGQEDALADMGTIVTLVPDHVELTRAWWREKNRELRAKATYLKNASLSAQTELSK
jgi:nitrite reductase/ring-hydroxylating ferredoxin subunit